MARKIIRAVDRDKAREESKKAAEAVPVKPVAEVAKPVAASQKLKPIKSIGDLDELSFSALQQYNVGYGYASSKPQPSDFTLDDMLKFVGDPSPGEEIKYRTDGGDSWQLLVCHRPEVLHSSA